MTRRDQMPEYVESWLRSQWREFSKELPQDGDIIEVCFMAFDVGDWLGCNELYDFYVATDTCETWMIRGRRSFDYFRPDSEMFQYTHWRPSYACFPEWEDKDETE